MIKLDTKEKIYTTIWTGEVDEIIEFEGLGKSMIKVRDVKTGKERIHYSGIDCDSLSTSSKPYSKENILDCIILLLEADFPFHLMNGLGYYRKYNQIEKLVVQRIKRYNHIFNKIL